MWDAFPPIALGKVEWKPQESENSDQPEPAVMSFL